MKVLFISHEDSKFGAPKSLIELIITLKKKYDIEPIVLLHSKDNIYRICDEENIEKHIVGHRNVITKKATDIKSFMNLIGKNLAYKSSKYISLKKIEKIIDMDTIDIIHTNVSIIDIGLELNKKYNIPHIIHMREPASIIENFHFCRKDYINVINLYSTKTIAISNYIKTEWKKRGVNEEKLQVIYNGLDLSQIGIAKHRNKKIRVVFTGSLSIEKGQMELIEAINILPEEMKTQLEVDFIGEGNREYKKLMIDRINTLKLEKNINIKGYIENISQKLADYDIGIISSIGEPFGRVTVEYMAAELCVIAANTGASPELIDNGINGYLYEHKNISDLAEKLKIVISDRSVINKIGEQARLKAFNKFSTETNADNIYSLYLKLLSR